MHASAFSGNSLPSNLAWGKYDRWLDLQAVQKAGKERWTVSFRLWVVLETLRSFSTDPAPFQWRPDEHSERREPPPKKEQ